MRIPRHCAYGKLKELLVLVIVLCPDFRVHPFECNK
jgi:hypothetical protein